MNTLYYGDNLKILRDHIKDESVDLIYLDQSTGRNATVTDRASSRNYNVLFKDESAPRPIRRYTPSKTPGTGTNAHA
jgi:hypothetical protein